MACVLVCVCVRNLQYCVPYFSTPLTRAGKQMGRAPGALFSLVELCAGLAQELTGHEESSRGRHAACDPPLGHGPLGTCRCICPWRRPPPCLCLPPTSFLVLADLHLPYVRHPVPVVHHGWHPGSADLGRPRCRGSSALASRSIPCGSAGFPPAPIPSASPGRDHAPQPPRRL